MLIAFCVFELCYFQKKLLVLNVFDCDNKKEKFKNETKNIERHFHDDFEEYLEEMLDKF